MEQQAAADPTVELWDAYFKAVDLQDILGAFDAMVSLGLRPLPITEDPATGRIKIPALGKAWGNSDLSFRRAKLERFISEQCEFHTSFLGPKGIR